MTKTVTLYFAVSNNGGIQWFLTRGRVNASGFNKFILLILSDKGRKKFIIVDDVKIHHNRKIRMEIINRREEAELFFFPAGSFRRGKKSPQKRAGQDSNEIINNEDYLSLGIPPVWWRATVKPH